MYTINFRTHQHFDVRLQSASHRDCRGIWCHSIRSGADAKNHNYTARDDRSCCMGHCTVICERYMSSTRFIYSLRYMHVCMRLYFTCIYDNMIQIKAVARLTSMPCMHALLQIPNATFTIQWLTCCRGLQRRIRRYACVKPCS